MFPREIRLGSQLMNATGAIKLPPLATPADSPAAASQVEDSEDSGMKSNGKKSHATANGTANHVQILTGDCREILTSLKAATVQCCVTSPPYWGLRDYDHPAQIGAEPSPEDYVSNLVTVFREVRRVLRNDGTFWLKSNDPGNPSWQVD